MKNYLFYDIETTGLNPCFDQVLQFAAIRTDLELNELSRYDLQVRLRNDVVPAPEAILTHRIGISYCQQNGISELEAMTMIHQLFNTPGTISLGYNTLGFDDEFLRFGFYRHLLPPYTHQYAKDCSRMDVYPLTILHYLFKPDVLIWPQHQQHVSLKLELLNQANQLAPGQAHHAMADVEATLALARKFLHHRETWDYMTQYFNKNTDLTRIAQLPTALLVDGKLGKNNHYLAPVLNLGQHHHYKNQTLWLRLDLENLLKMTINNIPEQSYVIRKKAGENRIILPMKPRYLEKLSAERQAIASQNQAWLEKNPELFAALCAYHREYTFPPVPGIDADAALYELGFPSAHEENLMRQFHEVPPAKKMGIANRFSSPIRQEQALRIMGRYFFNELDSENQERYKAYQLQAIHNDPQLAFIDYRGQRKLTLPAALTQINTLNIPEELRADFDLMKLSVKA